MKQKPKKDRRLRILWSSNAPWSMSGYGTQMHELLPLFQKEGWKQAISCFFGLEGGITEWKGITCYPKLSDMWGSDAMINHARDFNADITISQQDIWVLDINALPHFKRWTPWLPVDHDPIPPAVFERLKYCYRVIAYSKFAVEKMAEKGYASTYIPLTVDTKTFKPYDRGPIRQALNIPNDVFLFGMVAANKDYPPRKSFQEVMDAFKMFHEKHPKSALYFQAFTQQPGGFQIEEYARFLGISDYVYKPPAYDLHLKIGREDLAKVYNAFDVLLAPSRSEGFGVPIIEAQSCGIPVVANNITSMPELLIEGVTGELTEVSYMYFSPLGSYIGIPSVKSLYDKMEKLYVADRKKMGEEGRKWVKENYDTELVVKKHWTPYFEMVQEEIYGKKVDK